MNKKICLTITSFHKEEWSPSWTSTRNPQSVSLLVETIITAISSMFPVPTPGAIGSIETPDEEVRSLAQKVSLFHRANSQSTTYKCPKCGEIRKIVRPRLSPVSNKHSTYLFIGIILQVQNEPVQSIINNHHYRHHGHCLDHTRRQAAEQSTHAFRPLNEPQRLPDALLRVQHLLPCLHEIDRRDGRTGQHPAHRPRDEVLEDRRCSERVRGGAKSLVGCPVNRGKENVSDQQRLQAVVQAQEALGFGLVECYF